MRRDQEEARVPAGRAPRPRRRLPGMNAGMETVRRTFIWPLYGFLFFPAVLILLNAQGSASPAELLLFTAGALAQAVLGLPVLRESLQGFPWLERRWPSWRGLLPAALILVSGAVATILLAEDSPLLSRFALVVTHYHFFYVIAGFIGPLIAAAGMVATMLCLAQLGTVDTSPSVLIPVALILMMPWSVVWSSLWYLETLRSIDRVRERESRLAVAEERLRISRDLHDVLGRRFSAISVKSELGAQLATREGGEDSQAAAQLREIRELAHESLADMRGLVQSYRTTDLEQELSGARSLLSSAGAEVRIVGSAVAVPAGARDLAARVLREAVTNVLRHSRASLVSITLDSSGLRVENDGAAAPPRTDEGMPPADGDGTGLRSLRERVQDDGGRLHVEQRDGAFRLRAEFGAAAGRGLPTAPSISGAMTGTTGKEKS